VASTDYWHSAQMMAGTSLIEQDRVSPQNPNPGDGLVDAGK
jgi:hypothetical protein